MLERIREGSQGPWAMAIIGLVVLSFVFAGVGSYLTSSGTTAAATVNGEEISQDALERAYQNQRAQMESQYGESVAALFADEGYLRDFRQGVLERLIGEKLIEQRAVELGLRVSDEQIRETIVQMPEFQTGGSFDNDRYLAILRQSGFQASGFRDYLRVQLTREQLARAVSATAFALPTEVEGAYALQQQTRDARYLNIPADPFAENVEVTDQEVENFYQANITAFDTEEKISLSYVLLNVGDLKDDVEVSEEDITTWYQENQDLYRTDEERRISHILIESGDDEKAAQQEAAALLQKLQDGADFAELAKAHSDDTFSAENGGDLDYITRNMMDPAFDEAAFSLEETGDFSDVVETEFGFHIIKLTDIKPAQVTALEEVEQDIRNRLITDRATGRFFELQSRMAEIAFEVPDSLEEVAAVANGSVQQTGLFTRNTPPVPLDTPEAVNIAFSEELVDDRVNSDLIELNDETVAVIRVNEHQPQRTKPLEEVKEGIVATLTAQKAQQEAQRWAQSVVDKLANDEEVGDMLAQYQLEWQTKEGVSRNGGELARNLVEALFRLSPAPGNNVEVTTLTSGDVGIVELLGINHAGEAEPEMVRSLSQRLATMESRQAYQSYVEALRKDAEIEILAR